MMKKTLWTSHFLLGRGEVQSNTPNHPAMRLLGILRTLKKGRHLNIYPTDGFFMSACIQF